MLDDLIEVISQNIYQDLWGVMNGLLEAFPLITPLQ